VFSHAQYSPPSPEEFLDKNGKDEIGPGAAQLGLIQHGNSSGQPAKSRQSDAETVPPAQKPQGGGPS